MHLLINFIKEVIIKLFLFKKKNSNTLSNPQNTTIFVCAPNQKVIS